MKANNKMIAEFMGMEEHNFTGTFTKDIDKPLFHRNYLFPSELNYDKDWNWLMEVVKKILTISLKLDSMEMYYNITDSMPNIEQTYEAVVQFIEWYNNEQN